MKLTMHTGAHWQVELPADWILKNDNQGVLKFKSSDGNYGRKRSANYVFPQSV